MKPSMQYGSTATQLVGLPGASAVITCASRDPSPAVAKSSLLPGLPSGPWMSIFPAGRRRPKARCRSSTSSCMKASSLNSATACEAPGAAARLPGGMPRSRCRADRDCGLRGRTKPTGLSAGLTPRSTSHLLPRRPSIPVLALQSQRPCFGPSDGSAAPPSDEGSMCRQTAIRSTGRRLARPWILAARRPLPCPVKSVRWITCERYTPSCRNVSSRLCHVALPRVAGASDAFASDLFAGFAAASVELCLKSSKRPSLLGITLNPRLGDMRGSGPSAPAASRPSATATAGQRRPRRRRLGSLASPASSSAGSKQLHFVVGPARVLGQQIQPAKSPLHLALDFFLLSHLHGGCALQADSPLLVRPLQKPDGIGGVTTSSTASGGSGSVGDVSSQTGHAPERFAPSW
mmetsp:Transcript_46720/g.139467  ORF Transcript_46720/g.139467 Transcript_46720/m.139467 type:complete len:404 (-) Transcript_46720:214-1425(-)